MTSMMTRRELGAHARELQAELARVDTALGHAEDFDEVLRLMRRRAEIPIEINAAERAMGNQFRREQEDERAVNKARRDEYVAGLRSRAREVEKQLETETEPDERHDLLIEHDRLLSQIGEGGMP
jgi:hypothetical protein